MSEAAIEAIGDNVRAMASLAGKGLPPIHTATAGPQRTRLRGALGFAAVLALFGTAVVAAGVAFYPQTSDPSRERAEEAILPGSQVVAESAYALEHAEKLDDLAEAGAAAHAAISNVELLDARGISDPQFRTAAGGLLRAQLALLSAFAPLADLDESTVGNWGGHRREIRAAVRRIAKAQPAIAGVGLATEINVWSPLLSWSLANADAVVAKASRRLREWRSRVQEVRQERRTALAAMSAYESTVQRHLATYDGLSTDLDAWIRKVDTQGATFREADKFLGSASAALQRVRNGIGALHAPAGVASARANLLASIDRALAAVHSARTGDKRKDSDYTDAPEWQRFRSESDATDSNSAAARSSWQEAVAAQVERIESIKVPKRPDV